MVDDPDHTFKMLVSPRSDAEVLLMYPICNGVKYRLHIPSRSKVIIEIHGLLLGSSKIGHILMLMFGALALKARFGPEFLQLDCVGL